ncbi:Hypothetical protein EHI5A_128210 [Entamoeba histolytica KU27]|uniref:WH2 domain-containing protein n=1 Tax=Entamoeba histolytica KU27 TaxID=885311 RepID=M2SAF3_ENTHI|nr:Hypothetical protein EHI5A_128210 [Entamoeba histolytica KU27]
MSNKQTDIKTKDEVVQIERCTTETYQLMKKIIPNYKKLADACEGYFKAQLVMIKATDTLYNCLEAMADTSLEEGGQQTHPDLQVGVKNMSNVLKMWKENLMSVCDEFRSTCSCIRGDVTTFPKEIEAKEKEYKSQKKKEVDEVSKVEKKLSSVSKNTKLQAKDPKALADAITAVTKKESEYQHFLMNGLKDSLSMFRGTYGQLFECFRKLFICKTDTDNKSQLIISANMEDMQKLIKTSKGLPQKYRSLVTMKKQSMINTTWLSPELKEILKAAGVKPKHLADPTIVETLIQTVKQAVQQGTVPKDLLDQLEASRANKEDKLSKVIEVEDIVVPDRRPPPTPIARSSPRTAAPTTPAVATAPVPAAPADIPPPPPTAPMMDNIPPPPPVAPAIGNPPPPPPIAPPKQAGNPPPPPPIRSTNSAGNPPPPPPARQTAAPAPANGNLLADIRSGITLRSAADRKLDTAAPVVSDAGKQDLTSMLRKAMEVRRNDIADDEDDDDDDDDEWSD